MYGKNYENDNTDQEAMHTYLWGAEIYFYHRVTFKQMQCWQKCIDHSWDFVEKW
jgi:hypothetical protein